MRHSPPTKHAIIDRLRDELQELPRLEVREGRIEDSESDLRVDAVVAITVAHRELSLFLEVKKAVYPRDVREFLGRLWSSSRDPSGKRGGLRATEHLPVLVAESISPGAKEVLREEEIGYWDSGGSLFLTAPGVYILIDRPAPKSLKRTMRTLFSGRRAQTILTILSSHDRWVNVAQVAQLSGVSRPTVSQVMTELERQGFMESRGAGPNKKRRVEAPGALLDAWVMELPSLRKADARRRFFVPGIKADRLADQVARELDKKGVTYGLTGQAAAQRYAPFLSSSSDVSIRVLQSPGVDESVADLGGHEVDRGANLEVFEAKFEDEFKFREQVDDIWLLSPVQTYLDLVRSQGRSQELADHLRREKIGF